MKKFFVRFAVATMFLLAISVMEAKAETDDSKVVVATIPDYDKPDFRPIDDEGRRKPKARVMVLISEEGVDINGCSKDDVLSYSIFTEDGAQILYTTDEAEFATMALSVKNTVEIRVQMTEFSLRGWLH